jgi:Sel1 repeat-containing protein
MKTALALLVLLALIRLVSCDEPQSPKNANGDRLLAIEAGKSFVAKALKSPSTAQFSNVGAGKHGATWRVSGLVDSQNTFGGMMRAEWFVAVRRVQSDSWECAYLKVGEQEAGDSSAYDDPQKSNAADLVHPNTNQVSTLTDAEQRRYDNLKKLDGEKKDGMTRFALTQKQLSEQKKAEMLKRTVKFNQDAADKGDAYGQLRMGERYLNGEGVEKDESKAKEFLSKSAAQGNQNAAKLLERIKQ